jgi:hypothetical protein
MEEQEFSIFDPRRFFNEFVCRAYKDHLSDPADRYYIEVAIHQANVLAERVWATFDGRAPEKTAASNSASAYRKHLVKNECSDFQLVWDLDDGHKHVELDRKNRMVTSAAQAGIQQVGGAFDADAFDPDIFDTGKLELVVRLDDGSERLVSEVLANVVEMWGRLLKQL